MLSSLLNAVVMRLGLGLAYIKILLYKCAFNSPGFYSNDENFLKKLNLLFIRALAVLFFEMVINMLFKTSTYYLLAGARL